MKGDEFTPLLKQIKDASFSSAKITVVKTAASVQAFKVEQCISILKLFSSSSDKLAALEVLKDRINDPANKAKIPEVFSFSADKAKATALLADIKKAKATKIHKDALSVKQDPVSDKDFNAIVAAVKKESFSDGKLKALKAGIESQSRGVIASQVTTLVALLSMSADKKKALTILDDYALGMNCLEIIEVLKGLSMSGDKLEVLESIKYYITDPEHKFVILDQFTFSADKEKARKILEDVKPIPFAGRSPVYGSVSSERVVFLLDVSPSMEIAKFTTNQGETLNRLQFVARELLGVVENQFDDEVLFDIVKFGGKVVPWKSKLSKIDVPEVSAYLNNLRQIGSTNISGALDAAFKYPDVEEIYLLTDGTPNEGLSASRILDWIPGANKRKVKVNTIAFLSGSCPGEDKAGARALMYNVAALTGGVYRSIE